MNKYAAEQAFVHRRSRLVFASFIALFIAAGLFAFPKPWNKAMHWVEDKVGFHLPYLPEQEFRLGLDLQGGVHLVYDADMATVGEGERADALAGVRDVVERRVNAFGVGEPSVQTTTTGGSYRIIVDLPGVTDVASAISQIGETPVLTFRIPKENFDNIEATAEQEAQIEAAQQTERADALKVLDRALDGEDFAALVSEFSIDQATKDAAGDLGWISASDPEYGGLVEQIEDDRLRRGIIDGLYEGTSRIHIIDYQEKRVTKEPKVSHILVCYQGSTRCEQTRTKEEAEARAKEILAQVTRGNFAEKAKEFSDEPNASASGGDLGYMTPGMFVPSFETAVNSLKDNQLSGLVETEFGYHIIYRQSSRSVNEYHLAHVEMPWTTLSDIANVDPWENTALSGKHLARANVAFDPNTGAPYIVLDFNQEGADLFSQLTADHVGEVIGIFLDGQPITTPVVQQAIYGGQASITGNFTLEEAKLLAQRLNAGALPVPIAVVSQQTIGPTLGADSLHKSIIAGIVGFILIALFVTSYYRLPGLLAVIGLIFYVVINLALYKVFNVTVTLSGIAGFILSLGIAVDANVLVFERLKEELRDGRDLATAVDEAFRRAWPSIRDGNLTTLIATVTLYTMSTGFIRGFALTLTIGVLTSMFTALVVTRVLVTITSRFKAVQKPLFFLGLKRKTN